jgi:hypothetical protein
VLFAHLCIFPGEMPALCFCPLLIALSFIIELERSTDI